MEEISSNLVDQAKKARVKHIVKRSALLSSGISSSVVGILAGQAVMEGLLGMKVNVWLRRVVTRFINVIPTTIAILLGLDPLSSRFDHL